jgi:hypothetical protein|tara:strand:+ start:941 stop:1114 length:174 start_codon:yes stop_codon:yes gene_type:complete
MLIIKKKDCMKNNTFEKDSRTINSADEALSQSDKLLQDISNIFDTSDYTIAPLFRTN